MAELQFDILSGLPRELANRVLKHLTIIELASAQQVSKGWYAIVREPQVYQQACTRVWRDKLFVSAMARELEQQKHYYKALRESIIDSRRTAMTEDELVASTWAFRFKASAGDDWLTMDPWWSDLPARQLHFSPDGRLLGKSELRHEDRCAGSVYSNTLHD
eukprot:m.63062 g.63062  ORF g.63062 m.63062 type:complete len:161 (+) comp13950_c0_seq8:2-484(+)